MLQERYVTFKIRKEGAYERRIVDFRRIVV